MRAFLQDLFGDAVTPARRLVIFTTPGERWRRFGDLGQAVAYARRRAATDNVYFGLGLIRGTPRDRGAASDVGALGALGADVDLAGDAHPSKSLPPDVAAAEALLASLPLAPSVVVHSGHGLHPYWLLKEPWVFDAEPERERAAALARGWHGVVCD